MFTSWLGLHMTHRLLCKLLSQTDLIYVDNSAVPVGQVKFVFILNLIEQGLDVTKRSPSVLVPCHLGQNWSRADDLKFTTVNYYCKHDEIKKKDLAKNFEVRTYQFIMSVHCPLRVWAFEPSTIKLLCLQVVKSSIENSKNRKIEIVLHAFKVCTVVSVHI